MSLSDISGPGGNCTLPTGFNFHISAWSGTENITTVETTGFAEVGNRTYDATAIVWTGSAVGTAQQGAAASLVPSGGLGNTPTMSSYKGSITLTMSTGNTFAFTGVVSGLSIGRPHDGKADVTCNFMSSGPIVAVAT